jgi:hypothetical protein
VDAVRNPYTPGTGRKPSALVGRDEVLETWRVALERAERGKTDQPLVLYGLRGVGKTVLLTQLRHDAEKRDWWVVQVEAGADVGLRDLLGEGLYEPLSEIARQGLGRRALRALKTALSFKASYDAGGTWTFGVDLSGASGGGADSGVLRTDLKRIVKDVSLGAREEGVGLAILVDEAQDLSSDELTTLSMVAQAAAQDDWPVLFAVAGLPSLPQTLSEAKSYTERFHYSHIERLSHTDARAAFARPAQEEGAGWSDQALDYVVAESGRYPYFIQQFGQSSWDAAEGPVIEIADARVGVARGQNHLDSGFFRARWDRTTASEKRYLRAMCPGGDTGIGTGEVASRLGKNLNALGPTRAGLIHKGLAYAPDHGIIAFTVPGMESFIGRQPE